MRIVDRAYVAACRSTLLTSVVSFGARALRQQGWIRSRRENRCVDVEGRPVPWITYPAYEFLSRRVRPDMTVFEYGSGASTLWWASRVRRVIAVEHDAKWAQDVASCAPPNATVNHVPLDPKEPYVANAIGHGVSFDVVVIDGRLRVRCVPYTIQALNEGGVVLFDNSDRGHYARGFEALAEAGFRRLEFRGMGPINDEVWETSIFYRPGNCLGI